MLATRVVKRSGELVDFDVERIRSAILKAIHATGHELPPEQVDQLVDAVCEDIESRFGDFYPNVENIQDVVEKHLVLAGHYEIAKAYILYRSERRRVRIEAQERAIEDARLGKLTVAHDDGRRELLSAKAIADTLETAAGDDLIDAIDIPLLVRELAVGGVVLDEGGGALAQDADHAVRDRPSVDHLQGRLQRPLAAGPRRRRPQLEPVH